MRKKGILLIPMFFIFILLATSIFITSGERALSISAAEKKEKKMMLNFVKKKLKVGQKANLKIRNLTSSYSLSWSVDDANVANINAEGVITAISPGKTAITVIVNDKTKLVTRITVVSNKKKMKRSVEEQKIYKKIRSLRKEFKENSLWGDEKEYFCEKNNTIGSGCAALGFQFTDILFGKDAPMNKSEDLSGIKNKIRIGDLIRINQNTHTAIVIDKEEDGMILLEGNFFFGDAKEGRIHWGEKLTFDKFMEVGDYYVTRYKD